MKATVYVDGGPLDGSYTFDNFSPQNLNNTGLDIGSNEFHAWTMFDMTFCFGRGQIGYPVSGVSPAAMQRRLAGEKNVKTGPCNYELSDWQEQDGTIVARFRHVEWSEVTQHRAAQWA